MLLAPLTVQAADLLETYRQARGSDPVLSAADAQRHIVQEGVIQARAPLLPQLSAAFAADRTHVNGPLGSDTDAAGNADSRAATARLSQVVLDVARTDALRAARSLSDAQQALYDAEQQALIVRVATAYFDVLTASDALANVQANEDAFARQVREADERYRAGLSALVDVDQARAYHASARAGTIAAQQVLDDAREALAQITGVPTGPLKALREDLPMAPPQPADPSAWISGALAANPLVLAGQRTIDAAGHTIASARAGHLPTITAGVDVGRVAQRPGIDGSGRDTRTSTTVGLLVSVPLFAGGATDSQTREAAYRKGAAEDALEIQRRQIVRDTLARYRSVVAGIAETDTTRSAVDSARKALAATRVGQETGSHTMTDLLLAIQTLTAAQGAYSQARHRTILAGLLLKQSAGTVAEADLAAVNALLQ